MNDPKLSQLIGDRSLDDRQSQAISADHNTVVSAGAGAGKTTVLTYRFLRLILDGKARADSILTLTFTRKAASEMHERIHAMASAHRDLPEIAEAAAVLDRAEISTIDSFCVQIVRSDCRRYGISPDFVQDEDAIRELALQQSLSFILEHQEDPSMQYLLGLYSFDRLLHELFTPLAAYQSCPSRPIPFNRHVEQLLSIAEQAMPELMNALTTSAAMITTLEPRTKVMRSGIEFMQRFLDELVPKVQERSWSEAMGTVIRLSISMIRTPGNAKKEDMQLLKENILSFKGHWEEFSLCLHTIAQQELLRSVYAELACFQEQFLRAKRAAGVLSFSDIAQMSVDILIENRELRSYYKQRFTHIMIDEFQDNDRLQRDLLYLLAEREDLLSEGVPEGKDLDPDKLFFVGDEKQSIYRFRGADVSVFKALADEITSFGGDALKLVTNYRSEPGLISAFNRIFPEVMGDAQEPFEAVFEPLGTRAAHEQITPQIHIAVKERQQKDVLSNEELLHDNDAEAWYTAGLVRDLVQDGSLLIPDHDTGEVRPAAYSDIALLMGTLSNQMRYERAFRALSIPFTAQSVRALFLEAPVNDIYQYLQLLVYPDDLHAFTALLRSPFVNLSDDRILRMISYLQEHEELEAFDEGLCSELFWDQAEQERDRFLSAAALYEQLLSLSENSSTAQLIEHIWYAGGYRYVVLKDPAHHQYLEYVDYLRELALQSEQRGENLPEFLDAIRIRLGSNEKVPDVELLREQSEGVRIMTIHKSKGLEFPVVIITNTGNRGRTEQEPISFITDEGLFSVTAVPRIRLLNGNSGANYYFFIGKELRKRQSAAERKRLLYVAATRAETHLFVAGCRQGVDPEANLMNMLLDACRIDPEEPITGDRIICLDESSTPIMVHAIDDLTEEQSYAMGRKRPSVFHEDLKSDIYDAAELVTYEEHERSSAVTGYIAEQEQGQEQSHDIVWMDRLDSDAFLNESTTPRFGSLVHALIERTLKQQQTDDHELLLGFGGLSAEQQQVLLSDAQELADSFLSSPFYRRISADPASVIESEVAFTMRAPEGGMILNGIIDMLIETPEAMLVIDFKTDASRSPERHARQLKLYTDAIGSCTAKPVYGRIWYLREKEQEWRL